MTVVRIVRNVGVVSAAAAGSWAARIAAEGVVWYQPLSDAAEVDAFRWSLGFSSGNDPNANGTDADLLRLITDEDGSPCMECFYPGGSSHNSVHWIRPFSALDTGSGKAVNDPADGGALTVRAWAPTNGGGQTSGWQHGYYTHSSQMGSIPVGGTRDGAEYYIQVRVKMDARRKNAVDTDGDNTVGKLVWFTICEDSFVAGEHVTYSYGSGGNQGFKNYVRVYVATNGGTDPLNTGARIQENSESAADWYYSGGWDTLLYHVRPGQTGVSSGSDATMLEIWAAHEGETSYTKIWTQEYNVSSWFNGGHNALMLTYYNNSDTFDRDFYHRYREVIFSTQFIECPIDDVPTVPSWAQTPFEGFWKTISNNTLDDIDPDPGGSAGYTGTVGWDALTDSWAGAFIIPNYGESGVYGTFNGGHVDNYWNGVVAFDLATGLWSIFKDTYASASGGTATNGIWPDGTPATVHTYQQLAGLPWANKFIVGYRQVTNVPALTDSPSIFDFDTSTWDNRGEYIGTGFVTFDSSMMAVDINRQGVWMRGGITGAAFAFYDTEADDWTQYAGQGSEDDSSMCHDPNLDILVMVQEVGGSLLQGIHCGSPNTARVSLTQSGRPALPEAPGIVYSELRQAFIVWGTGENIYEVKKGSGAWDVATWTWTNLVDGANTVSTAANSTGCYSKLQLIAYGAREFIINCQQTSGAVYAFEVPAP